VARSALAKSTNHRPESRTLNLGPASLVFWHLAIIGRLPIVRPLVSQQRVRLTMVLNEAFAEN
jgi:hypothetical protein